MWRIFQTFTFDFEIWDILEAITHMIILIYMYFTRVVPM